MKLNKTLKISLIILIIVMISIISFLGIYVKDKNKYANKVKAYELGMDLEGSREVVLAIDETITKVNYDAEGKEIDASDKETEIARTEEKKPNSEEVLTTENYRKAKDVLKKRLKIMGVDNYEIRVDEETGKIVLNVPENQNTDLITSQMEYQGKFEIIDKETEEVLMTNNDLKTVKAAYGQSSTGKMAVYVQIEFNKEGTEKYREITNNYIKTTTVNEESGQEETTTKEISLKVDDTAILTTSFEEENDKGILQLTVGTGSSTEDLQENLQQASNLSAILDSGKMEIKYKTESNRYVESEITLDNVKLFICLAIVAITVAMIYLVTAYKEKGILATIALLGYVATLLLTIRYTNATITISGLVSIVLSIVLEYISVIMILKHGKKFKDAVKEFILAIIPIIAIAVVFTFNTWLNVVSFGMIMFWGVAVSLIYNLVITRTLLNSKD